MGFSGTHIIQILPRYGVFRHTHRSDPARVWGFRHTHTPLTPYPDIRLLGTHTAQTLPGYGGFRHTHTPLRPYPGMGFLGTHTSLRPGPGMDRTQLWGGKFTKVRTDFSHLSVPEIN